MQKLNWLRRRTMKRVEPLIDEGLRVSLVETAFFDGDIEIPHIDAPDRIVIPQGMVPFSQRDRDLEQKSFVCFYENDVNFREILTHTEGFVDDLKRPVLLHLTARCILTRRLWCS